MPYSQTRLRTAHSYQGAGKLYSYRYQGAGELYSYRYQGAGKQLQLPGRGQADARTLYGPNDDDFSLPRLVNLPDVILRFAQDLRRWQAHRSGRRSFASLRMTHDHCRFWLFTFMFVV